MKNLGFEINIYADDCTIVVSGKSKEEVISKICEVMRVISIWFSANKLKLNVEKTQIIYHRAGCTSTCLNPLDFMIGDVVHSSVPSTKFLGVLLDVSLKWDNHINSLCSKIAQKVYLMSKLSFCCSKATLMSAYFGLIQSNIQYNIVNWGFTSKANVSRLLILKKKALRIINEIGNKESCRPHFKDLGTLTVPSFIILEACIFYCFKRHLFEDVKVDHGHETRHKNKFVPIKLGCTVDRSPYYWCPVLYHKLPENIQQKITVSSFRESLKNYLCENVFYSLDEFLQMAENT